MKIISRRFFLGTLALTSPFAAAGYAWALEPRWLRIRTIRLNDPPACRFVHFSDLHHKGNVRLLRNVIDTINTLNPEFVCFTGDIVEDDAYLSEALDELARLQMPAYGCPGNHDYWSGSDFGVIAAVFEAIGGAWLLDDVREILPGKVGVVGLKEMAFPDHLNAGTPAQILLAHYPETADRVPVDRFSLMLAGHSHGGQIRFPFVGAMVLPGGCGEYDRGLFKTARGPLYVNPGIGTWLIPARFMCRPELTVIEL